MEREKSVVVREVRHAVMAACFAVKERSAPNHTAAAQIL